MLSTAENELLTRVTGEAPMGQMMRRYWVPACLAEEIAEAQSTPVQLFGDRLIAFRDASGRTAVVDERVPRRSYPVRESGGLVWTFLGPPGTEPPFAEYDWARLPKAQRAIVKIGERANYLQALEGSIDSSHSWFLHRGAVWDWRTRTSVSTDLAPRLEAEDTAYGFRYAAIRRPNVNPETERYVRVTLFVVPFTAIIPRPIDPTKMAHAQIFAPVDDERTMFYGIFFSQDGSTIDEQEVRRDLCAERGVQLDAAYFKYATIENWWNQDRAAMRQESWVGIDGFPNQDMACQESMGPIVDRTQEHLGTSDIAIIRMRRRMLEAVRRFREGEPLIGQDRTIRYDLVRSEQKIVPIDVPWQSVGAYAGEYVAPAVAK